MVTNFYFFHRVIFHNCATSINKIIIYIFFKLIIRILLFQHTSVDTRLVVCSSKQWHRIISDTKKVYT